MPTTCDTKAERLDKLAGCLLGMAVGDALGLPREGLSKQRAARLFGSAPLRHRFIGGHGMVSDDTAHAMMTARALLAAGGEVEHFRRALAWQMRGWLLGGPAGIGLATLKACVRLWLGVPPTHSGVRSAGNGPAMRTPVLGAAVDDDGQLRALVEASTRMTHTDPRAEEGAMLIALAAREGMRQGPALAQAQVLASLKAAVNGQELHTALESLAAHLARGADAETFARSLGCEHGVSGYINHTVPVALFCWLRYQHDFQQAVESAILLGGDTDTVGAIVGGLLGATLGAKAIPAAWLTGLAEWPCSVQQMRRLAEALAGEPVSLPSTLLWWPAVLVRNSVFTMIVLLHGFRRLLPPY